jgi:integrase
MIPVEDVAESAAKALEEFQRQWPYLAQDLSPPPVYAKGCTMQHLCKTFLAMKRNRLDVGELSEYTYTSYVRACELMLIFFGRERRVEDLQPDDFEKFRMSLAQGCGVVTLKTKINGCRVVLKYASDHRLIDLPVAYGRAFDRPSEKLLRSARNAAGERMFEAAELRRILKAADPVMRAMVMLGINCGFGNTDVASLPQSAVDLQGGWIKFPRPKTAVQRRIPIWPETVTALRKAIAIRPAPVDRADADLCFVTRRGTRYVRAQQSQRSAGRYSNVNALGRRFELLLYRLGMDDRVGRGFYTLRHVFETIAGESRDQVGVNAIMGHVDSSMAGQYRERISDERLRMVVECVRNWLFPKRKPACENSIDLLRSELDRRTEVAAPPMEFNQCG